MKPYDMHNPRCPNCGSTHHLYRRTDFHYLTAERVWSALDDDEVNVECTECDCIFDFVTGEILSGGTL